MSVPTERYSPTFLATFLGCRQAAVWDLRRRRGGEDVRPDGLDAHGALITRLGDEHEARILAALEASSEVAVIRAPAADDAGDAVDATLRAMEAGVPWVHQAALADGRWFGYADFLRRVEIPCERWPWSYEPWDAKLARRAAPKHVLQISVYGELLAGLQGGAPKGMGLMLGTGAATGDGEPTHVPVRYAFDNFRYYTARVARRLVACAESLPDDFGGEPCTACGQCHWSGRCEATWRSLDHLSRVADISAEQRRRLVDANVTTLGALADLADAPRDARPGIRLRVETLDRLIAQAALQRRSERASGSIGSDATPAGADDPCSPEHDHRGSHARGAPAWETLPRRDGFGLDRLPPPDAADLYFDFEGDPLEPGGLEYLCGVLARSDVDGPFASGELVPKRSGEARPDYRFRAFWAHDRGEERRSFEALIDAFVDHLERHPDARLYHYAPYEASAMKRLAMTHGTRERAVDELLRENRLVDLYRVVREGVRVGAPSYSIKKLEPLYMDARATDTADGGESVVMYHAWRASGDPATLADIETYNRDDCVSTALLHGWLLARADALGRGPDANAPDALDGGDAGAEPEVGESDAERKKRERREQRLLERAEIETEVTRLERVLDADEGTEEPPASPSTPPPAEGPASSSDEPAPPLTAADVARARERDARRLAADLLRFHEREDKPEWWAFFERQDATPDALVDDADCLGGCVADPSRWGEPDKRSHLYRFRFPPQETKLGRGAQAALQSGASAGTIVELDAREGVLVLKRGAALGEPPERLALMPGGPLDTSPIAGAVRRVVRDFAEYGDTYDHLARLLRGDPPRLRGHAPGAPIVDPGASDPAAVLDATIDAVRRLDRSWLCIQGPPGAGKTFTLARVIHALIEDGLRVGVSSNSHAAIDNVLRGVETFREASGARPLEGFKRASGEPYASPLEEPMIRTSRTKSDWNPEADLFGGTAWWFSAEDGPKVDVLVVDEAGQVSLGHLVGMASAARNVLLVGDPMQLPQPTKGTHPRASGASCLEHAIGAHAVIPPERGVFLGTTWRMHPTLARFVSDAIYDGRLAAEPGCANQRLALPKGTHPTLKSAGLAFVELDHDGCAQRSEPEADEIARVYADLLAARVIDRHGVERAMTPSDILVVAPYNLQVNLLRERLDPLAAGANRRRGLPDETPGAEPAGARVGTVDRFQGQEAEAVIVSMTTSDAGSMPRDASFLLSRNRFNVAISRARCLAIVVASSGLLDLDVRSVEEMRLVNLLCRARAEADEPA